MRIGRCVVLGAGFCFKETQRNGRMHFPHQRGMAQAAYFLPTTLFSLWVMVISVTFKT